MKNLPLVATTNVSMNRTIMFVEKGLVYRLFDKECMKLISKRDIMQTYIFNSPVFIPSKFSRSKRVAFQNNCENVNIFSRRVDLN